MAKKKNSDVVALSGALVITLAVLLGGGVLLSQAGGLKAFGSRTTVQSTVRDPRAKTSLAALGDTFSGYSTLRSEAFQSDLLERGVGLAYGDEFDQKLRADAINRGDTDLMVTSLDQFLTHRPEGKIVGLIDRTVGADAVLLNSQRFPQLQSLIDLEALVAQRQSQGKTNKIVFAGDTPSEFLALVLDTSFDNFNLSNFEVVKVADAVEAWKQLQTDSDVLMSVLWEPFVTEAVNQGNTVVLSSADVPKVIVDVIVASDRSLAEKPEAVQQFVEAYYRRIDASMQDPGLLTRQIALDGDLDAAQAQSVAQGIQFFTSAEAQDWMESGQLEKRMQAISGILALAGRAQPLTEAGSELFTDEFVAPLAAQTEALLTAIAADNPELAQQLKNQAKPAVVKTLSSQQINQANPIGHLNIKGEVTFNSGSATLAGESQRALQQLAAEISEFSPNTVAVKIQGHTSRSGSAALNQTLSQQRAAVVVDYLKEQQLPHHLAAEGLGFSNPLPAIDPASPLNQRTVIRLVRIGG